MRTRTLRREFGAVLNERTRIAREIHDTLLQGFAGAALQLNAVLRKLKGAPERAAEDLEKVLDQIDSCLADARQEIIHLRSRGEGAGGFEERLRCAVTAASREDLQVDCVFKGQPITLGYDVEKNLIRIAQEAVSNTARHSNAHSAKVTLEVGPTSIRLETVDDGSGMKPAGDGRGHFGIAGMRERAKLMGGKFNLKSAPNQGTGIEVVIPRRRT
jgi:signal transduction histidine kinase